MTTQNTNRRLTTGREANIARQQGRYDLAVAQFDVTRSRSARLLHAHTAYAAAMELGYLRGFDRAWFKRAGEWSVRQEEYAK